MSKASLYGYFRAKDEMLAAISRETIESFTRELGLVLRSSLPPEDKLRLLRGVRLATRFDLAIEPATFTPRRSDRLRATRDEVLAIAERREDAQLIETQRDQTYAQRDRDIPDSDRRKRN